MWTVEWPSVTIFMTGCQSSTHVPDQIKAGEGRKPRWPVLPREEETQTVMKWYICHSLRLYCLYNHSKLTHCVEEVICHVSTVWSYIFFVTYLQGITRGLLQRKLFFVLRERRLWCRGPDVISCDVKIIKVTTKRWRRRDDGEGSERRQLPDGEETDLTSSGETTQPWPCYNH